MAVKLAWFFLNICNYAFHTLGFIRIVHAKILSHLIWQLLVLHSSPDIYGLIMHQLLSPVAQKL